MQLCVQTEFISGCSIFFCCGKMLFKISPVVVMGVNNESWPLFGFGVFFCI